jgi:hypothetical protein
VKITRHRSLRTIGWVAAYVLALHTILAGFVAFPAKAALNGVDLAALCLTAPDHGSDRNGAAHGGQDHCAACFVAGSALPPAEPTLHPVAYAVSHEPEIVAAAHAALRRLAGRPGLPRAPPSVLA